MATKKKAEPKAEKPEQPAQQPEKPAAEGILQETAKKIGTAIGKAAVKTGLVHTTPAKKKIPKLAKKDKKRLPRKAKKQAKKKLLAG
jgi:hypothetical protein